jgi:hypothetical protein
MHKLAELQNKFELSGINNNPVITNVELEYLFDGLVDMSTYFKDRGDRLISHALRMKATSVENMIYARKMK